MIPLLESAIEQLSSLPGVGKKTAMRYALHLLGQPKENVNFFARSISDLRNNVCYCKICNMISETEVCSFCNDPKRISSIICVVENIRDIISIEATEEYRGLYFVLGGLISPMDGIGPDDLPISRLIERASSDEINEVVLVLNTNMEGETTSFYLYKLLSKENIKVTTIARGVGFGDDLEYTDLLTLGRSISNRQLYNPK